MKPKPFQADIKSRGPMFAQTIDEARSQSRSGTGYHTLDINDVIIGDPKVAAAT